MDENGKIVAHVVVVLKVEEVEVEAEVVAVVVVVVEVVAAGVEVALCRATCQTCSKMFLTSWTHFADLFFASCRLRTDNWNGLKHINHDQVPTWPYYKNLLEKLPRSWPPESPWSWSNSDNSIQMPDWNLSTPTSHWLWQCPAVPIFNCCCWMSTMKASPTDSFLDTPRCRATSKAAPQLPIECT